VRRQAPLLLTTSPVKLTTVINVIVLGLIVEGNNIFVLFLRLGSRVPFLVSFVALRKAEGLDAQQQDDEKQLLCRRLMGAYYVEPPKQDRP
jgi:hypothetical protein